MRKIIWHLGGKVTKGLDRQEGVNLFTSPSKYIFPFPSHIFFFCKILIHRLNKITSNCLYFLTNQTSSVITSTLKLNSQKLIAFSSNPAAIPKNLHIDNFPPFIKRSKLWIDRKAKYPLPYNFSTNKISNKECRFRLVLDLHPLQ